MLGPLRIFYTKCAVAGRKRAVLNATILEEIQQKDDLVTIPVEQWDQYQRDMSVCVECCDTELCNVKGCGEQGLPPNSGPICYGCDQNRDPDTCDRIILCDRDYACHLSTKRIGVDLVYESGCIHTQDCHQQGDLHTGAYEIVGRRDVDITSIFKRAVFCNKCCTQNLCNSDNCSSLTHPPTTLPPTTTTIAQATTTLAPELPQVAILGLKPNYHIGDKVDLTCNASGQPAPLVTWQKVGTSGHCTSSNLTTVNGHLVLDNLSPADTGIYKCVSHNSYGSAEKEVTIHSNDSHPLDCDFETGLCKWNNSKADRADWMLNRGSTPTGQTGPTGDHTNNSGYYIYLESSNNQSGDKADLISPLMPATQDACFTFWYHTYGIGIGDIVVKTKACSGQESEKLRLSGNKGTSWNFSQVQFTNMDKDFQILIEAIHGNGIYGDAAIDDVKYTLGKCHGTLNPIGPSSETIHVKENQTLSLTCPVTSSPQTTYSWTKLHGCFRNYTKTGNLINITPISIGDEGTYICTASDGGQTVTKEFHIIVDSSGHNFCDFESGLCTWGLDERGKFNWTSGHSPTPSADTGPDVDHTYGTTSGHFMFIETSSPRVRGDNAVLKSELLPASNMKCLNLWYNMYGVDIDYLNIYTDDTCTKVKTRVDFVHGNQGQAWHKLSVTIPAQTNDYHILIEGNTGSSYHGDIAIDDVTIANGKCSGTVFECDFENNECGMIESKVDSFDWIRQKGTTSSAGTGPNADHTMGTASGYYIYIEASSPRVTGDKADIITPSLDPNTVYCLDFWYSMYGDTMGSIRVDTASPTLSNRNNLWFTSGNQGQGWHNLKLNVPTQSAAFVLVFEGIRGMDFTSDAAIDDIKVTQGTCS